jgi:DNA-binding MarR family transcriptional regulator
MPSDNVSQLINLFFMTTRSLHKHIQKVEIVKAFSLLQFIAMRVVVEDDSVSMKDMARILSITPASATSLINGLVNMGALERIVDKSDRRIIRLHATAYGKKTLNAAEGKAKKELESVFVQLTDSDRNMMIAGLEKLSAILDRQKPSFSPKRAASIGTRR